MRKVNLIKNVLTQPERKRLLQDIKPFLKEFGPDWPGRQSNANLHLYSQFEEILKRFLLIAQRVIGEELMWGPREEGPVSFFTETNGTKESMHWHTHNSHYTGVYYIKTFPFFSNGTLFRDGFFKAPQNSLIIFPSSLEHTSPRSPLPFKRYSMGLNFIRIYNEV